MGYIMLMKQRALYSIMLGGASIGLIASFLETLEYQLLLKNAHATLSCNLNSVLNCSNVLHAWQSKVFGFPNSMLCIIFFTMMLVSALAGLSGSTLGRRFRLWLQGFALFFLCFALWFMYESVFVIRSLCILCLFCFAGLLSVNWSWLRLNAKDLPIGQALRKRLSCLIEQGADTFVWLTLALTIGFLMFIRFHH